MNAKCKPLLLLFPPACFSSRRLIAPCLRCYHPPSSLPERGSNVPSANDTTTLSVSAVAYHQRKTFEGIASSLSKYEKLLQLNRDISTNDLLQLSSKLLSYYMTAGLSASYRSNLPLHLLLYVFKSQESHIEPRKLIINNLMFSWLFQAEYAHVYSFIYQLIKYESATSSSSPVTTESPYKEICEILSKTPIQLWSLYYLGQLLIKLGFYSLYRSDALTLYEIIMALFQRGLFIKTVKVYQISLLQLANVQHPTYVTKVYQYLKERDGLNEACYKALFTYYCKKGATEDAFLLYKEEIREKYIESDKLMGEIITRFIRCNCLEYSLHVFNVFKASKSWRDSNDSSIRERIEREIYELLFKFDKHKIQLYLSHFLDDTGNPSSHKYIRLPYVKRNGPRLLKLLYKVEGLQSLACYLSMIPFDAQIDIYVLDFLSSYLLLLLFDVTKARKDYFDQLLSHFKMLIPYSYETFAKPEKTSLSGLFKEIDRNLFIFMNYIEVNRVLLDSCTFNLLLSWSLANLEEKSSLMLIEYFFDHDKTALYTRDNLLLALSFLIRLNAWRLIILLLDDRSMKEPAPPKVKALLTDTRYATMMYPHLETLKYALKKDPIYSDIELLDDLLSTNNMDLGVNKTEVSRICKENNIVTVGDLRKSDIIHSLQFILLKVKVELPLKVAQIKEAIING